MFAIVTAPVLLSQPQRRELLFKGSIIFVFVSSQKGRYIQSVQGAAAHDSFIMPHTVLYPAYMCGLFGHSLYPTLLFVEFTLLQWGKQLIHCRFTTMGDVIRLIGSGVFRLLLDL